MGDLVMPDGTPFVVPEGGVNFTADEAEAFNATCSAHATNTMGLSQFDVSANKLIGMLPTTFGDLVNLQAIDVSRNTELGAEEYWAKLAPNGTDEYHRQFYSYDKMIPTEMGTLKKLQVLKMDNSRFMKHIPTELGNMRSMRYWDVKGSDGIDMYSESETNAVSGSIPIDIANMTSLQRWVLPDNKLSGTIPNIFAS